MLLLLLAACRCCCCSFYCAHRDNDGASPSDRRQLTAILYLNDRWTEADGGALRCHLGADRADEDGGTARQVVDVLPHVSVLTPSSATFLGSSFFRSHFLLHSKIVPA